MNYGDTDDGNVAYYLASDFAGTNGNLTTGSSIAKRLVELDKGIRVKSRLKTKKRWHCTLASQSNSQVIWLNLDQETLEKQQGAGHCNVPCSVQCQKMKSLMCSQFFCNHHCLSGPNCCTHFTCPRHTWFERRCFNWEVTACIFPQYKFQMLVVCYLSHKFCLAK